jgi:cyclophilin family peptidyl-prolyl cis-trans isomerase
MIALTGTGLVLALVLAVVGVKTLAGSASPSATGSPSRAPAVGQVTGAVTPQPAPTQVACGAKAPATAGQQKQQFAGPPLLVIDTSKTYTAVMKTSCGTIVIRLDSKNALETVNSFVFLAGHNFFDGQYFTRLDTTIDVVQGGDPTGTGKGGPGYSIPDELHSKPTYGTGTVAMANSGSPNSGGSQFFLITGPKGHQLDTKPTYTVFGTIVQGLDVAQRIQGMPIKDPTAGLLGQAPAQAIYIDSVTIIKR